MSNKISWGVILVFASVLFIYGLLTRNIYVSIGALLIGLLCEKRGYSTLFEEYDTKKAEKIEELKRRRIKDE